LVRGAPEAARAPALGAAALRLGRAREPAPGRDRRPGRGASRGIHLRLVKKHRFESMGCEVVVGGATARELRAIEELFAERERVFSRFRPDSELNGVNRSAGRFVAVSPLFAQTLAVALHAARETGGLVDPTLGAALEAAGYDRDFASLAPVEEPPAAGRPGAWRSVLLIGRRVGVPRGLRLDLNGVVKALAVDDALKILPGPGFA